LVRELPCCERRVTTTFHSKRIADNRMFGEAFQYGGSSCSERCRRLALPPICATRRSGAAVLKDLHLEGPTARRQPTAVDLSIQLMSRNVCASPTDFLCLLLKKLVHSCAKTVGDQLKLPSLQSMKVILLCVPVVVLLILIRKFGPLKSQWPAPAERSDR